MELLEEDLTCPICCSLFEDPRVLPCSHSFCRKCLEGILEGNRSQSWRPSFKCPTCRKETLNTGTNSLQVNYSLRGIVEKYNRIRTMSTMSVCRQHSGQPLNIFCATDLKLICGFCATEDHKGHTFCALEDAYQQEKAAFEELFQVFKNWRRTDIMSCLESLETSKKKSLELVSKDARKVNAYFDQLISTLDQKKNEILSDFETMKLMVMQAYDPEINKLSAVLEEQRLALSIAESFRGASDPLRFLQQMQEFRGKLSAIQETPLPAPTNVTVGHLVKKFDVKNWDTVKLGDVDKLAAPHEFSAGGSARPRHFRWLWGLSIFVCFFLSAVLFLESETLSFLSTNISAVYHFLRPLVDETNYAVVCWTKVSSVCLFLFEMCQTCLFNLFSSTLD
ncbi:hypothetical protein AAFF_G00432840 [Aldrovandia affinis]|uniref:E3 ubiquitin-protein ligase TRIM13 n=1 Tax=Aldrovandia affinis TaxID=143900 RepID=A0AAD7S8G0_9TELE|nr:hypothetical protein AAFF_G00432840 [Aldrovandia affinis]